MEMGIAVLFVMDREIRTHTGGDKSIADEGTGKPQLFLPVQFYRQGNLYLTGKLCVTGLFNHLHTVPESAAVLKFRRGMGRQYDFRVDYATFPGVIMGKPVPFVGHFGSAPVSGSAYGRLGFAALDNLDGHMEYGYGGSPPFGWE